MYFWDSNGSKKLTTPQILKFIRHTPYTVRDGRVCNRTHRMGKFWDGLLGTTANGTSIFFQLSPLCLPILNTALCTWISKIEKNTTFWIFLIWIEKNTFIKPHQQFFFESELKNYLLKTSPPIFLNQVNWKKVSLFFKTSPTEFLDLNWKNYLLIPFWIWIEPHYLIKASPTKLF